MKNYYVLILFFFASIIITNTNAQGTWTRKADLIGNTRSGATGFTIGTKCYITTGGDEANHIFYNDLWEWDQATNTWSQKANFGGAARELASGFSIGTKGYVGTGSINTPPYYVTDFWEWDQPSNIWTQKADFAGAGRCTAAAFSIGTEGYLGTGYADGTYTKDFWQWDQATNTWTQEADFGGTVRERTVSFTIGTKGYIGTGGIGGYTCYKDFWEWDQATNIWTQKADFGGGNRHNASGFAIGTKGYIGTGTDDSNIFYKDFWEWDQATNIWTQEADFGGGIRDVAVGLSIGAKGYMGTGGNSPGLIGDSIIYKDFWEYASVSPPIVNFQSSDSTICANDCISFTNLSSNATSYQWLFPGAMPTTDTAQSPLLVCYTAAGNYDVTLIATNAGGSDTLTFQNYITVNPAPPAPNITESHDTLFFGTNPTYKSYQWYSDSSLITGATDTFLVITHNGNYNVKVTNIYGCDVAVGTNITIGINEFYAADYVSFFPNPTTKQLTIHTSSLHANEVITISIMNVLGEIMQEEKLKWSRDVIINVKNLPSGIYFLQMKSENGSAVKKFVKE